MSCTFYHKYKVDYITNCIASYIILSGIRLCLNFIISVYLLYIGTRNYACAVHERDLTVAEQYAESPGPPASLEFLELARIIVNEHQLDFPLVIKDAVNFICTTCFYT